MKNIYFDLDKLHVMLATNMVCEYITYVIKNNYNYKDENEDLLYFLKDFLTSHDEFGFLNIKILNDKDTVKLTYDANSQADGFENATKYIADVVFGRKLLTYSFDGENFKKLYFHGTITREGGFIVVNNEFTNETIMLKPLVATETEIIGPGDYHELV